MYKKPSKKKIREYVLEDTSHLFADTGTEIIRNVVIIVLISSITWAICSCLIYSVHHLNHYWFNKVDEFSFSKSCLLIISVLFFGALIRVILSMKFNWRKQEGDGVAITLKYFHDTYQVDKEACENDLRKRYKKPLLSAAIKRFLLTFITLGSMGSGGLEGPSFPIGESIGAWFSKIFKIKNGNDLRTFQMTGIAAAVTTLLHSPFAGAICAAEIVFADKFVYRAIFYSLIGSVVASFLNTKFFPNNVLFDIFKDKQNHDILDYIIIIGIVICFCVPVSRMIKKGLNSTHYFLQKTPDLLRPFVSIVIISLTAISFWYFFNIHPKHLLGMGEETLKEVLYGVDNLNIWWVLLLIIVGKIITTSFTIMSGGSAGILIPAMYIGGILGSGVYLLFSSLFPTIFNHDEIIFIIVGIASALVSIIEIPLTAIIFVIEMFGSGYSTIAIIVCSFTHLLVKKYNLYSN